MNNCNLDYFWDSKVKNVFMYKNQKFRGLELVCLAVFPPLGFNGGKNKAAFAHLSSQPKVEVKIRKGKLTAKTHLIQVSNLQSLCRSSED